MISQLNMVLALVSIGIQSIPANLAPYFDVGSQGHSGGAPPQSLYLKDDEITREQIRQMGPDILASLTEVIEHYIPPNDQGDVKAAILFEEISGCEPCVYQNNGTIFTSAYADDCHEIPAGPMPDFSDNIDINPLVTAAIGPRVVKWWNARMEFPKADILSQRLRSITGNSEPQFRQYGACQSALLSRDVFIYGIYALPALIEVMGADNNVCVFAEFLQKYEHGLFNELCYEPCSKHPCHEYLREMYPRTSDKLRFIHNWWHAVRDTYTTLPELRDEIERKIASFPIEDTLNSVTGYLDEVERPDIKVPSLSSTPNIYTIRQFMPLSDVENALGCRAALVNHRTAPNAFREDSGLFKAIWRWPGTKELSNYLVVYLDKDMEVAYFRICHGWLYPGLPIYSDKGQDTWAADAHEEISQAPSKGTQGSGERNTPTSQLYPVSRKVVWRIIAASACASMCIAASYLSVDWLRKRRP